MTKVTVLLTSDKETIIVLLGDAVEDTPIIATDIKPGTSLENALAAIEKALKASGAGLLFYMQGGLYDPESAAQYEPEKIAEFDIDNPELDDFIEQVKA